MGSQSQLPHPNGSETNLPFVRMSVKAVKSSRAAACKYFEFRMFDSISLVSRRAAPHSAPDHTPGCSAGSSLDEAFGACQSS